MIKIILSDIDGTFLDNDKKTPALRSTKRRLKPSSLRV